jgi:hypothetical protein
MGALWIFRRVMGRKVNGIMQVEKCDEKTGDGRVRYTWRYETYDKQERI